MNAVIMTILCMLLAVSAEAQSLVPLKGTRVSVAPPEGFVLAERFAGYMSDETGASIMVTEMQAPFAETIKGFDRNGFRKHGLTLLSKQGAVFGDFKGYIFSVFQEIEGVVILKWMAAFGDERTFYMVTAAFPKDHEAELSEPLKKSVLGARVVATQAQAEAGLTFRISEMYDMKIARVMGNNIIMSKGGVSPAKRMETPILVAGASASKEMVLSDRKAFARAYLQKIPKMKGFKVRAEKAVTIDGLDGLESVAEGTDTDSGAKALVYQVVLFDPDGYYYIVGVASEQAGKVQLSIFQAIARSFKRQ